MRILDRYILGKFLGIIFFSLIALNSIFIVIDVVEKISDFLDKGTPTGVIIQYYIYFIPYIIVLTLPLAMLLASMFSIGTLSKHSELVAMKASGLSLVRILTPLLLSSLVISIFIIFFAEFVVPKANSAKAEIKAKYIDKKSSFSRASVANLALHDSSNRYIFIGNYNTFDSSAQKISILSRVRGRIVERIDAERMVWRDGHWVFENVAIRDLRGEQEKLTTLESADSLAFEFLPGDLGAVQKKPEEMSYEELEQFINEVRRNGGDADRWLVDLYLKIAFPFANFIIVLFGAPLAASRVRSSGAVGVALSFFFCFFYFGAVKIGQTLGQTGTLEPMFAAWMGNIIFFIAGIIILIRAPK